MKTLVVLLAVVAVGLAAAIEEKKYKFPWQNFFRPQQAPGFPKMTDMKEFCNGKFLNDLGDGTAMDSFKTLGDFIRKMVCGPNVLKKPESEAPSHE